jgi:hypothetical protein
MDCKVADPEPTTTGYGSLQAEDVEKVIWLRRERWDE